MSQEKKSFELSLRTIIAILFLVGGFGMLLYSGWTTFAPVGEPIPLPTIAPSIAVEGGEEKAVSFGQPEFNAPKTALIVDQLSQYYPNPTLIETATTLLESAGYSVTYISNKDVTVDFYRTLPKRADDFIILRVHGTAVSRNREGELVEEAFTALATGELESREHIEYQKNGWLGRFVPDNPDELPTFSIMEGFLKNAMEGRFDNSTILLIGCDGMRGYAGTARFFMERGANAVVGWTDNVSVTHMDAAIEELLEEHLRAEQSIAEATANVHELLGPDPYYKSELRAVVRQ